MHRLSSTWIAVAAVTIALVWWDCSRAARAAEPVVRGTHDDGYRVFKCSSDFEGKHRFYQDSPCPNGWGMKINPARLSGNQVAQLAREPLKPSDQGKAK